ncbi:hypothetical protein BELL_0130g00010 [Botrytis elliptica]|uniref:ribonuclease H n=1 Tax=Botrytis elliptica TaxID=278938 RepID=A0A4Z1JT01_9HELO|nr:hypothetical protein EAE99_009712 [Botrytis elliptica]TGO76931.1 hypothetical protein BELL_0130g00010 [Botrytis elliptica]
MLTIIKKTRVIVPPSLSRAISQTYKNPGIMMKKWHSQEHYRVRAFDPRLSDGTLVTPKDVQYNKDSGTSYFEYPEADFVYYETGVYSPRAFVVAVDGACPGNGTTRAERSSFGVFFGPDSPFNTYGTIARPSGEKHTNNYSELMAILHALELLKHHSGLRNYISEHPLLIHHSFRVDVIIITDSKFVHSCLTSWLPIWLKNGFRTVEGNSVANKDLILRIHHMIELLSDNVDIQLWHVGREHNRDADELAVRALRTQTTNQAQDIASSSLQHFRSGIIHRAPRIIHLAHEIGIFPQNNCMEMNLGDIIMSMVIAGTDHGAHFKTLFGPEYGSDSLYVMYRKLIRAVLYLSLDEPGHYSYPDSVIWMARSTSKYQLAGKHPRPIDTYEARKLRKWCIDNRLFSDGKHLTSLLELIHTFRLEFGLDVSLGS